MRKLPIAILTLLLVGMTACTYTPEDLHLELVRCADIPQARVCATAFTIGDTAYIFGGRDANKNAQNDLWTYSSTDNQWRHKETTPLAARVNAAACVVGETAYLGLGFKGYIRDTASYLNDFWSYTPRTNTWKRLADYPAHTTDKAVCLTDGTHIYVCYGYFTRFSREVYEYTLATNTWRRIADNTGEYDFPYRTMGATGTACGKRLFLGTGFNHVSRNFWVELTPDSTTIWTKRAEIPGKGRCLSATTATNQYIYVAGGLYQGGTVTDGFLHNDILRYSPAQDQWWHCTTMPNEGLENLVAFTLGNEVFIGLGEDERGCAQTALYKLTEE